MPVEGGLFAFGEGIPFSVTVTDPEDGTVNCARVAVTFVLGHDTHGHAEESTTGCSGTLPTDPADVSHGGNVWGVISAPYTDIGGAGGTPGLTTVDEGTSVNASSRSSSRSTSQVRTRHPRRRGRRSAPREPAPGDWIELNGPINLVNIDRDHVPGRATRPPAARRLVELDRDAFDGPIVATYTIEPAANGTALVSQTFPITDPGGTNQLFLVFRSVTGGPATTCSISTGSSSSAGVSGRRSVNYRAGCPRGWPVAPSGAERRAHEERQAPDTESAGGPAEDDQPAAASGRCGCGGGHGVRGRPGERVRRDEGEGHEGAQWAAHPRREAGHDHLHPT